MLFMVKTEWVEAGIMLRPEDAVPYIEQVIIPSLEMLTQWEQDGRILAGGAFPGERSGVIVIDADSAEEVGQLLGSLPYWGHMKWEVRALQSLSSTIDRERAVVERTRAALG